jgi:FHA domain
LNTIIGPSFVAPRGDSVILAPGRSTIGRDRTATIQIVDQAVDAHHADIIRSGSDVLLVDLGSDVGTFVNEERVPAGAVATLRHNDVVRIGTTPFRFVSAPAETAPPPPEISSSGAPSIGRSAPEPAVTFRTDTQHAGQINNVGGNQFLQQQRESFLREIASSRTRARRLIWLGFFLFVGGVATYAAMLLQLAGNHSATPEELYRDGFATYGLVGFGVAGLGSILLVLGVILHVIATSRRRRALSDPTWTSPTRRS